MSLDKHDCNGRTGLSQMKRFIDGKASIVIDLNKKSMTVNGRRVGLPDRAMELVCVMARNPKRSWSTDEMLEELYPDHGQRPGPHALAVLMNFIDDALGDVRLIRYAYRSLDIIAQEA